MLKEFRDFLIKGNVVDMAVGFIFGAAFATLIKSLVTNVIMPPIGLLFPNNSIRFKIESPKWL